MQEEAASQDAYLSSQTKIQRMLLVVADAQKLLQRVLRVTRLQRADELTADDMLMLR